MWIRANLVLGAGGQSTFEGTSKALSSRFDRAKFHAIRADAQAILIGGNTARIEPYGKTPVRLIVLSKSGDIPNSITANSSAEIWALSPAEAIAKLRGEGVERILVEAGPSIVAELSSQNLLDGLYLTQTNFDKGENAVDIEAITANMVMESVEDSEDESFIYYGRN
jgi:riboflavin biosynthesis pyrimidine reductase